MREAIRKAARQMTAMLPVMLGVILLVGLFHAAVSKTWMVSLFTGAPLTDAFFGAVFGSILAGNPVNSYVIGKGLSDAGVGFVAVAAVILTWVMVGVVQLPAEATAFGVRFALARAAIAFVLSIPLACLASYLVGIIL